MNINKHPNIMAADKINRDAYKPGEYIVFAGGKLFAHGKDIDRILNKVEKEYPQEVPYIVKNPPRGMLIL